MSLTTHYLKSLFLTTLFSFITPLLLVSGSFGATYLLGWVPGLESLSQTGVKLGLTFLATFGTGSPFKGLIIISSTCAGVGALFDTYIFYRQQNFGRS